MVALFALKANMVNVKVSFTMFVNLCLRHLQLNRITVFVPERQKVYN